MRNVITESEVISGWKGDLSRPLVSVCCASYNHENYIEDALEGFLVQCTDFPFEILIHDDASTDRTAEIIREYQQKYPLIIKTILQSENQYSKGKRAVQALIPLARGRYVALCEGDDFWSDSNKLQIQIDFLESHPDYVISGHDAFVVDAQRRQIKGSKLPLKHQRDFSSEELIRGDAWVLTMSRLFRNVVTDFPPEMSMVKSVDKFYISLLGHFGKSKYHDDIQPAAYRVHSGGVWSMISAKTRRNAQINTNFWIYQYYTRTGEDLYARHYWRKYLSYVFRAACPGDLFRALVVRLVRWGWKCDN